MAYLPGLAMRRIADLHAGEAKTDARDAAIIAEVARSMRSRSKSGASAPTPVESMSIGKSPGFRRSCASNVPARNRFHPDALNPYLNFHRPCCFAVDQIDARGKIRKICPREQIRTPWGRLKSISSHQDCLKPGIASESLEHEAYARSDNEAANRVQRPENGCSNHSTVDPDPHPACATRTAILSGSGMPVAGWFGVCSILLLDSGFSVRIRPHLAAWASAPAAK